MIKTLKKLFIELKGNLGQSSLNGFQNSSSSVNPFAIARHYGSLLSQRKNVLVKQPIYVAIVMVMHYFHPVLEHGLNLNHNAYSVFPRIHLRRESMARSTRYISTLPVLSEWTLTHQACCICIKMMGQSRLNRM